MKRRIAIFGTSGMAREAGDIADALGMSALFIARDSHEQSNIPESADVILESEIGRLKNTQFIIGIADNPIRRRIATSYAGRLDFTNLIHPSATFGRSQRKLVENRKGVIISAGVRLTCNIVVGDFSIINLNASVSHDSIIGDFVTISPHACILGNVEIKSGAWIGAGAIINQGTNETKRIIGSNTVIGSGAVVLRDCAANFTYVGVPAMKIG